MRILVATAHQAVVGGVETYLRAILPLLRTSGHDVGLLCAYAADSGRPTVDDNCPGMSVSVVSDAMSVSTTAAKWRPDVVYTHDLPDSAADAALANWFPTVYFAHNYAGTCVSGTKCHATPVWRPCSRRLGPACLGLYLPRRCGGLNPVTALKLYRTNRRRQALFGGYQAVLSASNHMATELIHSGVPPERVHLVPLFPPDSRPDPEPPPTKPRTNRVIFVGRLTAIKGWRELLVALPIASANLGRSLTLVVAGDGPDREAFETEARRRRIPSEFLGWIRPEKRMAEMRAADILVVPSVWPEPFGLVGIEAGCVGLPAVAFAVGGIPDWLIPGRSGELAPGSRPNASELAEAIVRALGDENHLQRLRVGAWEVAHRFSPETHLARLIPVFEAVTHRGVAVPNRSST